MALIKGKGIKWRVKGHTSTPWSTHTFVLGLTSKRTSYREMQKPGQAVFKGIWPVIEICGK
jgi:hypothetical protein